MEGGRKHNPQLDQATLNGGIALSRVVSADNNPGQPLMLQRSQSTPVKIHKAVELQLAMPKTEHCGLVYHPWFG